MTERSDSQYDPAAREGDCSTLARWLSAHNAHTVLIDGRSGSGKSSFAAVLAAAWEQALSGGAPADSRRPRVHVVHLDDIYPGWDGLDWASEHVRTDLLAPRDAGLPGSWRQWDWSAERPGPVRSVPADAPLVVEGVGALTAASRALADLGVWVEAPDGVRRGRALARDREMYGPFWEVWRVQEDEFLQREHPRGYADAVVDNAATREIAEASSRWVVHSSIGVAPSER